MKYIYDKVTVRIVCFFIQLNYNILGVFNVKAILVEERLWWYLIPWLGEGRVHNPRI